MPANKYDCFAASLPMLKPDGGQGLSVQAFLDDCEQQLTSADFQALTAARLGAGESSSHAVARAWQQHDREVRDLQDGEALFKLHWQFLDSLVPASFFNLDYLAVASSRSTTRPGMRCWNKSAAAWHHSDRTP